MNDDLTSEQRRIVSAGPDERLLVTAGPGTGKTRVLVARLAKLVDEDDVAPGMGLLVLSFSRAAVGEIRERLRHRDEEVRFVRAYTFDGFASRLLSSLAETDDRAQGSYDARIVEATRLLSSEAAADLIGDYRHVLVDEVQDLVGVRADFVLRILEVVQAGFTLMGDPAQSIYNFQLKGEARREGSARLYCQVRERFAHPAAGPALREFTLSVNHRAQTELARQGLWAGAALASSQPDYTAILRRLEDTLDSLVDLGSVQDAGPLLAALEGTTAVLCRDNREALLLSRKLRQTGVPHRLQRSARERAAPAWIARLLSDFRGVRFTRQDLDARLDRLTDGLQANEAWTSLRRLAADGKSISVAKLHEYLRTQVLPEHLNSQPDASIVVSTIHRAKGLEFDTVILVDPKQPNETDDAISGEETRTLYVALTRPRRNLYRMSGLKPYGFNRLLDGRWRRCRNRGLTGLEIMGDDASEERPESGADGAADVQAYIDRHVRPGDALVLHALTPDGNGELPSYAITHGTRRVGTTSTAFATALRAALNYRTRTYPQRFEDVYVDVIDTVAGDRHAARTAGLGDAGIWMRVRPGGLARPVFKKESNP